VLQYALFPAGKRHWEKVDTIEESAQMSGSKETIVVGLIFVANVNI